MAVEPNNGSFEEYAYDSNQNMNVPTGWFLENYAVAVNNFYPHPEAGEYINWRFNFNTGLIPFDGDSFIVLSSGDWPGGSFYAKASQNITVEANEKISGVYFFGTCDYYDFNDFSYIRLVPLQEDSTHSEITLAYESLYSVCYPEFDRFSSLSGWKRFEHVFTAEEAGSYTLVLYVSDCQDNAWDTYLAVDSIRILHEPSIDGDFNCDGTTNFNDFRFIAHDWGCDCNDPVNYNDPNHNCLLGTDIDKNGPVDFNDMGIFMNSWLTGVKEE
jgi:hypothetical protein